MFLSTCNLDTIYLSRDLDTLEYTEVNEEPGYNQGYHQVRLERSQVLDATAQAKNSPAAHKRSTTLCDRCARAQHVSEGALGQRVLPMRCRSKNAGKQRQVQCNFASVCLPGANYPRFSVAFCLFIAAPSLFPMPLRRSRERETKRCKLFRRGREKVEGIN